MHLVFRSELGEKKFVLSPVEKLNFRPRRNIFRPRRAQRAKMDNLGSFQAFSWDFLLQDQPAQHHKQGLLPGTTPTKAQV